MTDEACNRDPSNMLHTQLHKISCQVGSAAAATDDYTSIPYPKAHFAPPTLFCQPPTPEEEDPFDDFCSPSPNHQMKTFVPQRWNGETYISFPVDRIAFRHLFKLFAKYGNPNRSTETMSLTNSDKWLRQARVIDQRKITTVDTGIYFRQVARSKKALSIKEYEQYLDFIAKKKGMDPDQIKYMLTSCGSPKASIKKKIAGEDDGVDWTTDYHMSTRHLRPRFPFPERNLGSLEYIFDNEGQREPYGYNSENVFCRF